MNAVLVGHIGDEIIQWSIASLKAQRAKICKRRACLLMHFVDTVALTLFVLGNFLLTLYWGGAFFDPSFSPKIQKI